MGTLFGPWTMILNISTWWVPAMVVCYTSYISLVLPNKIDSFTRCYSKYIKRSDIANSDIGPTELIFWVCKMTRTLKFSLALKINHKKEVIYCSIILDVWLRKYLSCELEQRYIRAMRKASRYHRTDDRHFMYNEDWNFTECYGTHFSFNGAFVILLVYTAGCYRNISCLG